jgi:chitodextrinase
LPVIKQSDNEPQHPNLLYNVIMIKLLSSFRNAPFFSKIVTITSTTVVAILLASGLFVQSVSAAAAFKQVKASTPATPQSTVATTFAQPQTAGDLNVVVIGWNQATGTVNSVTDSKGNTYQVAAVMARGNSMSQVVYYAKNIASATAGSNTVSVTFSTSVAYPDIRILEYSGLDQTNPLGANSSASGNSTTANSGAVVTGTANELLVGAGITSGGFNSAGSGFTSRVITNDGDIVEDRNAATAGSYSAAAPVSGSWIMQAVAFRTAAATADTTAPSVPANLAATAVSSTQIDLSWTASTDNVAVTGYRLERCQNAGCSNFTLLTTAGGTTYSDSSLSASTSYSYRVRATDAAGNLSAYSNISQATTQAPPAPDTTAPSVPTGLTASSASTSQANLSWNASTDNISVTGYKVFRDGTQIGTSSTVSYQDTGLTAATTYSYTVSAYDAAGNNSAQSAPATATTAVASACPLTTPHTPGGPDTTGTCWPGPGNTGVPVGTALSVYNGPCVITAANTVIDAKTVNCDVDIRAANVTIKNSKVNGLVVLDTDLAGSSAWSFSLLDAEVDAGTQQRAAVSTGNMTVRRANIHGGITAAQCEEKSVSCNIQDSWLHGQYIPPTANWHLGGFLSDGGGNIQLIHNMVVCDHAANQVDEGCTGDINLIPNFAVVSGVLIQHNLLGANLGSAYCTFGGEKSTSPYPHANNVTYRDNIFQRGSNGQCAAYGPVTDFNSTGTGNQWVNNSWDDGGQVPAAN